MTVERLIVGQYGANKQVYSAPARLDTSTMSLQTIDYYHHEIHAGSHYYMEGFATLAADEALYVKLVTPDLARWAHFIWDIQSSAILEVTLHEGASGGMTGGTAVTPLNNNRNSANTSVMTITSGVTVATDLGLTISQSKVGARKFGASIGRDAELILKQDTVYLRKFLSGTNDNLVSFKASWYEHTDKA